MRTICRVLYIVLFIILPLKSFSQSFSASFESEYFSTFSDLDKLLPAKSIVRFNNNIVTYTATVYVIGQGEKQIHNVFTIYKTEEGSDSDVLIMYATSMDNSYKRLILFSFPDKPMDLAIGDILIRDLRLIDAK